MTAPPQPPHPAPPRPSESDRQARDGTHDAPTIAQIAGATARALRLGSNVTLEQFATTTKFYGLKWSSGRVSAFESGQTAPTLPTLIIVAAALSDLLGHNVAITDLLTGKGRVTINDRLSLTLTTVRSALCEGAAVKAADVTVDHNQMMSDSDLRMCRNIGVDRDLGAAAMMKLWGKPFTAKRDELTEPGANAQRRGQVSRRLKAELVKVVVSR